VRRLAVLFTALLFLSAVGTATLISKLVDGYGLGGSPVAVLPIASVTVIGIFIVALLVAAMRRFAVPLGDIVEAANRVAEGDYSARVGQQGAPSMRTVGSAFNTMASRLESQARQRRDLMADIAHELRTPLSVIQGRLEGLLDGVYPRDDQTIGEVIAETRLLARLVDDLRTLANAESGTLHLQKEATDLAVLIQDVVRSLSVEVRDRHVSLGVDAPATLPLITVDPLRIREVVTNVMLNALNHTPADGTVSITASVLNEWMAVTVTDTGSGIAPDELPKIFDRFYKGRSSRGSGLGLTIARNLVSAHGGAIRAESLPGRGTTVTLTLPVDPK
jgi:two-component system OmpR family sensor kinase/two-component system sensor histidine kinase BaeS